ncbi:hypothetical protein BaRGS_00002775, partial [Batillaria attramentaria]
TLSKSWPNCPSSSARIVTSVSYRPPQTHVHWRRCARKRRSVTRRSRSLVLKTVLTSCTDK